MKLYEGVYTRNNDEFLAKIVARNEQKAVELFIKFIQKNSYYGEFKSIAFIGKISVVQK